VSHKDPEARRLYARMWRALNRARILAYQRNWSEMNRDKIKVYNDARPRKTDRTVNFWNLA